MLALEHARAVKLMAFDVDGVLTDGRLYFSANGDEIKAFASRDGHGMRLLQSEGVRLAIITGRSSRSVELRANNLGIDIVKQGVSDKRGVLREVLAELGMSFENAGFMGDDVVDLPVIRSCGFSATVADGHELVRRHVDYVARYPAGRGAVREVCELILRAQGKLDHALAPFLA